jgi:hypothetical protein
MHFAVRFRLGVLRAGMPRSRLPLPRQSRIRHWPQRKGRHPRTGGSGSRGPEPRTRPPVQSRRSRLIQRDAGEPLVKCIHASGSVRVYATRRRSGKRASQLCRARAGKNSRPQTWRRTTSLRYERRSSIRVASRMTRSYITFRSTGSSRWNSARSDQSRRNGNWMTPVTGPSSSPRVSGSRYGRFSVYVRPATVTSVVMYDSVT